MDTSKVPDDSSTVIVIEVNAVSPVSTSANGKSAITKPVKVVSSVPTWLEGVDVVGASLAPVRVTVTVIEAVVPAPSETIAVKVSVGVASASNAFVLTSVLSIV